MAFDIQLILCSIEEPLAQAWEEHCGDLDFVRVHRGSILDLEVDAVVSPANSFGFMDGGIDALYDRHFGPELERRVRKQILNHHAGELLVGAADVVETGDSAIPYLIIAPTMRVPMILRDAVNAYLAARAVFLLVRDGRFTAGPNAGQPVGDHIRSVALPGLGTGVGRVPPQICSRQVRAAIDDIILGQSRMPQTWAEASERHQLLYGARPRDLQFG